MKQHWTYLIMTALALCTLLSGCEKEEAVDANAWRVEAVLSPGGVGDQGYNDKILRGLQLAAAQYGFTLAIHIPEEKEQGIQIYNEWLNAPLDNDCERSLFVFSGSEYEYLLDSLPLPQDERKDVLMFETERQVEGIYTFFVGCYAASYLAGATSVFDNEGEEQKALVIAANPHDIQVKRAVDGYRDGYLAAGGDGCDVHYLSEELDGGYRMQDEAYKFCMENDGNYMYYFSAAGASNKGLYRFSREHANMAVGMDVDMGLFSSMITMSVVKHMDRVVFDVLGDLLNNRKIPYHQAFTYTSGYEELVYSTEFTEDWFLDISHIKNRIVEIEQRYEEANQ
ncbi:MAG: hypothetical protein UCJ13_10265 [Bacteroidaceae bacterium]|nr:hypothetical protein [Bacteroidaceae bacterium]